jgi:hypothetical protein
MFNVKKKAPGGTGMDITCPVLNRLAIGDKECRLHTWSPKPMVPKNVAEILQNHVLLEVEGIDRLYLNGYVSLVQTEGGAATFIRRQLGKPFASTAAVAPMTSQFSCQDKSETSGVPPGGMKLVVVTQWVRAKRLKSHLPKA